MSTFVPFSSPCDVIDIAPYKRLKLEYRTVDVVGVKNLKVSSIQFKNDKGQVINLARSIGTDKENVRLLRDSFLNQGWDGLQTDKELHEKLYEMIHKVGIEPGEAFLLLYGILISKEKGPKLAGFMRIIGKEKILSLLGDVL